MDDRRLRGSFGYFFGRLDTPDELTIAFLAETEDMVTGLAAMLADIGEENLKVIFKLLPTGVVEIIIEDKRDPDNFTDHRLRPVTHISRFLQDFEEDKKFIITVGDLELNMAYDKLRLEMDRVEWVAEYLH
jgi:hypothetical protein